MTRFLTAFVLGALMLASVGCLSIDDSIRKAASGTIRDLRIVRAEVVSQLPYGEVVIGDKTWTLRGIWDNRLAAMIVRERSIVAGIDKDKSFDTVKVSKEEGVTKEPR